MAKLLDIILVIDLEATCWEGKTPEGQRQEIIEIGLCPLDLATGERLERRSILVLPELSEVSPFCEELTTITQDMLNRDGVPLREAFRILKKEYMSQRRVWASWGDFDRRLIERECEARHMGYPMGPTHLNAKTLFSLLHGMTREHGMARAMELLGLPLEGTHHRGHDDAWNIAAALSTLIGPKSAGFFNQMLAIQDEDDEG